MKMSKTPLKCPHNFVSTSYLKEKITTEHKIGFYRDRWYTKFTDPYQRAALFYLLNRYSETGHFSHTEVTKHNFSPLNLQTLERFAPVVKTIEMIYDNQRDFTVSFEHLEPSSVLLVSAGEYKQTFLKGKNVRSPETYYFNHEKLREYLLSKRQKVVLVYKYNHFTDKFFNNKTYINKLGFVTENPELAEDLIVSNF